MSESNLTTNPYQSTSEVSFDPFTQAPGQYGGIGRLPYFLASIGLSIIQNLVQAGIMMSVGAESAVIVALSLGAVGLAGNAYLAGQRMINQGSSGWWGLGIFIPLVNLWVALRCLICPAGYTDHKTLDTAGKVIALLLLGLVALVVIALFLVVGTSA